MSSKKQPKLKTKKPRALVVVAHPDDEALFFSGLILSKRNYDWTIICASDGNADGQGALRQKQFQDSCRLLGAHGQSWGLPDLFDQPLDTTLLETKLRGLAPFKMAFTHGILGEYGHRHHQDVSLAVHTALIEKMKVYSVAYNIFPDITIKLSPAIFQKKQKLLWNVYASETKRLLHFLPATSYEGFTEVSKKEVDLIYKWLREGVPAKKRDLKVYGWLYDYLAEGGGQLSSRPF